MKQLQNALRIALQNGSSAREIRKLQLALAVARAVRARKLSTEK
jgi:hypothetical protein